ncbi:hypothetical protein PR048_015056 [Dryococelus australis]|uniref:Transposase n=1 Tax=Dryococelus australis TaxID=614101 RepID=A0ABQ9HFY2_9NEOP|nr:hypothetical protein PR048_015056 [Dryococelus australis]
MTSEGQSVDDVIGHYLESKHQVMGSPCKYIHQCFEKFSKDEKSIIIHSFNDLDDKEKQDCYLRLPRAHTYLYKIKDGENETCVCKKAFVSLQRITYTLQHLQVKGVITVHGQINSQMTCVKSIMERINSFSKRSSHYSRTDNQKRYYLSPELIVAKMHRLFLEKQEMSVVEKNTTEVEECCSSSVHDDNSRPISATPVVSYDLYINVFLDNFNMSFGTPRTDTCQKYGKIENAMKATSSEDEKEKLETGKAFHLSKAEWCYKDLKDKMKVAKTDDSLGTLAFDFQQNLPLPMVSSQDDFIRDSYECFHSAFTQKKLGRVFSICMTRLQEESRQTKLYPVFMISCKIQSHLVSRHCIYFLTTVVHKTKILPFEEIVCFPELGHCYLPCDRSFGVVEKEKCKRQRLYIPSDYSQLISSVSCKFQVKMMNRTDFLDYKNSLAQSFKKKVVSDTRVLDIPKAKDKLKNCVLKNDVEPKGKNECVIVGPREHMKPAAASLHDEAVFKAATDKLAQHMKMTDFKSSVGWLWCFQALSVPTEEIKPFQKKLEQLIDSEGLLSQIYNADETGLYWRDVNSWMGICKERIYALVCSNADRSHRLTPVMVAKSRQTSVEIPGRPMYTKVGWLLPKRMGEVLVTHYYYWRYEWIAFFRRVITQPLRFYLIRGSPMRAMCFVQSSRISLLQALKFHIAFSSKMPTLATSKKHICD